ncbi:MAG: hypothetical protein AAGF81_22530 [Pseudomonadota bacterium]
MSRSTNLIIWLIGLLGCAIPIVIIFVSNMVPDAGSVSGVTMMDVARQSYANVLFLVIAVSGIAIAEAIILFFKMVEVGEQKATPALWLLTMVLLIVFSSISYARVLGGEFNPDSVSDQQLTLACIGASVAIVAALSLRVSMIRLEGIARQHIHDNAVMSTLEEMRDSDDHLDLYDFDPFPGTTPLKPEESSGETRIPDPPKRSEPSPEPTPAPAPAPAPAPVAPAAAPSKPSDTKASLLAPFMKAAEPDTPEPETPEPVAAEPEPAAPKEEPPRLPETPPSTVAMPEKPEPKTAEKAAEVSEPEPTPDSRPVPVAGKKVKRARARARAKGR